MNICKNLKDHFEPSFVELIWVFKKKGTKMNLLNNIKDQSEFTYQHFHHFQQVYQ